MSALCPFCGAELNPKSLSVVGKGRGRLKQYHVTYYHDGAGCIGKLTFIVRATARDETGAIIAAEERMAQRPAPEPAGE